MSQFRYVDLELHGSIRNSFTMNFRQLFTIMGNVYSFHRNIGRLSTKSTVANNKQYMVSVC